MTHVESEVRFHEDNNETSSIRIPSSNRPSHVGIELSERRPSPSIETSSFVVDLSETQYDSNGPSQNGTNGATATTNGTTKKLKSHASFGQEHVRSILVWRDLTVTVKGRSGPPKVLLRNVSGCMTGGMWAVMGPSGCGKSTLLNTLACRLDVNTTVVGEMRLNGRPYHNAELKKMSGYVMQDDLLNGSLTVRETLYYTAALRLPRTFTSQERAERVEEVIREMGLTHCQDVIVGDPQQKGISGGERRRLCIGMELLMRPTLLFLDEPTSGLDSVTAVSLGRLLRRLSRTRKCSVICSIHQPAARLFALFDRLLLLKSGRILYQGSIPGALQLFEDCGFPVPHYSNPADHILDVITPPMDGTLALKKAAELSTAARDADRDRQFGFKGQGPLQMEIAAAGDQEHNHAVSSKNGLSIDVSKVNSWPADDHLSDATPLGRALTLRRRYTLERSQQLEARHFMTPIKGDDAETAVTPGRDDLRNEAILLKNFQLPPVDLTLGQDKPQLDSDVIGVSWFRQLRILMERNTKETWRKRHKVMIAFIQSLIMAVLIGTVFLFIGTSQTSVVRRQPVLQFLCINQGAFAAMSIINAFPAERSLMLRERAAGTYYASAYFLARTTIDTLVQIPQIVCFSVVTYYLIGLQDVASKFIIYLLFMILCNLSATSLALMVSALCKTTDFATVMLSFVLEVCRLFGGFFLAPKNLPKYFSWLDALSYIKYSYVGISLNELHGLELHCNPGQFKKDSNGNEFCPITSGQFTIDQLGLGFISMNGCAGVLVGYIIFCRLVAYWGIRNLKH